jgi:hypothetical protein
MKNVFREVEVQQEVNPIALEKKARRKWAKRLGNLEGLLRHLRGCSRSEDVATGFNGEEQRLLGLLEAMIHSARVMVSGSMLEKDLLDGEGFEELFDLVHTQVVQDVFAFAAAADGDFVI